MQEPKSVRMGQDCQQDLFYARKANVGERGRLDHKELLGGQCFPSACDACYTVLEDQALPKEYSNHQVAGAAALPACHAFCFPPSCVTRLETVLYTRCDRVSFL